MEDSFLTEKKPFFILNNIVLKWIFIILFFALTKEIFLAFRIWTDPTKLYINLGCQHWALYFPASLLLLG